MTAESGKIQLIKVCSPAFRRLIVDNKQHKIKVEIKSFKNIEKLNNFAAQKFIEIAKDFIEKRGQFTVALSGGSTPKKLFAILVNKPFRSQIEWQKIHFFFGDERFVQKDSEESNFRMANEALFSKVGIPAENIHEFQTEKGDAETVAKLMEQEIRKVFGIENQPVAPPLKAMHEPQSPMQFPRFDLIFLGMGADGHTASLFPHTQALQETDKIAVENWIEKFETFRLTFTFPTINNARNIIFLIAGADKKETLREVLEGEFQPEKLPSQMVKPTNGNLLFLTATE